MNASAGRNLTGREPTLRAGVANLNIFDFSDDGAMTPAFERRRRIQVRVYPTLPAHDREDAAWWAALPVVERVQLVWTLSEAHYRLRGELPDESGLPRSVAALSEFHSRQGTPALNGHRRGRSLIALGPAGPRITPSSRIVGDPTTGETRS
jgi:hypothetical protein